MSFKIEDRDEIECRFHFTVCIEQHFELGGF